ncbi:MAG: hypothetical protein KatS3mg105_1870 [Gemmatales bacterium]|nr:MAG: hypothetical protein KatS3mg105_1870 [Gemmatales bacterium]
MKDAMNSQQFFVALVKHVVDKLGDEEDNILACMIVLHTQDILVNDNCRLVDVSWPVGAPHRLHAITGRHAAEVVATALGHESQQAIDEWYSMYCTQTPYEVLKSVPKPMMEKVENVIRCISEHPLVESVVDAD